MPHPFYTLPPAPRASIRTSVPVAGGRFSGQVRKYEALQKSAKVAKKGNGPGSRRHICVSVVSRSAKGQWRMRILVVGAGKPLGADIAITLADAGHDILATRRSSYGLDDRLLAAGIQIAELDVLDRIAVRLAAKDIDAAVLTPILSTSTNAVRELAEVGISRGVAFSSNNVAITPEEETYRALADAEDAVLSAAPGWAVLRPTMIYGHPGDQNLSRLLDYVAKWPVLPVPGTATALQQPIHLSDLARLAAALVTEDCDLKGVVPVGGPDTLPQWDVVRMACGVVGDRCTPVQVPLGFIRGWAGLGLPTPVSLAQLDRAELDKTVIGQPALPNELMPSVTLEAGLTRLAEEMRLIPPRH